MTRTAAILGLTAVLSASAVSCQTEEPAAWAPVQGRIMSRWAAEVRPDRVLPEYPRPQLVRDRWLNLNGLWDVAFTAREAGRPEEWDGRILVPFAAESALSGVGQPVGAAKALWYRRDGQGAAQVAAAAASSPPLRRGRLGEHGLGQREGGRHPSRRLRSLQLRHHGTA